MIIDELLIVNDYIVQNLNVNLTIRNGYDMIL